MIIKAPFNFVPLSDNVFFPEWSKQISHDVPFSDGECGIIELSMTAETPIFVRNGYNRGVSKDNTKYLNFNNHNGTYFIPSTTIKGAIRNVLEIASFGKMARISDDRYSLRDLQLKKQYLSFFQNSDVHCGWLTKIDDSTVKITDHGIPRRISHWDLDKAWGTNFSTIFKDAELLRKDENRTAFYKINLAKGKTTKGVFTEIPLNPDNAVDKRIKVFFDPTGTLKGEIVLTGQPSARKDRVIDNNGTVIKKGSGKCYEFVFPETVENEFTLDTENTKGIYKDFCFIYKESSDWLFWHKQLESGKAVPVFFSIKDDSLIHFGLSYLYKLPAKKRMKEFLPELHRNENMDLSECIFGVTSSDDSLKGRVQFSHCFLISGSPSGVILKPYMGSPKPSYYPIYLEQEGTNGYPSKEFTTFLDKDVKLKGWKRYPVHEETSPFILLDGVKEENLNPFIPIESGAVFTCKVRFQNLRKSEIGALLFSIGISKNFSHSIGFAKAYGYGKIKFESPKLVNCNFETQDYINCFKELMEASIENYSKSEQINELRLMGSYHATTSPLEYMELTDFVECKKQKRNTTDKNSFDKTGEYLEYYSKLIRKNVDDTSPNLLIEEAEIVFFRYPVFQAKLLTGKDTSQKNIIDCPSNTKFKIGDHVLVKKVIIGGNIKHLVFVKKIENS